MEALVEKFKSDNPNVQRSVLYALVQQSLPKITTGNNFSASLEQLQNNSPLQQIISFLKLYSHKCKTVQVVLQDGLVLMYKLFVEQVKSSLANPKLNTIFDFADYLLFDTLLSQLHFTLQQQKQMGKMLLNLFIRAIVDITIFQMELEYQISLQNEKNERKIICKSVTTQKNIFFNLIKLYPESAFELVHRLIPVLITSKFPFQYAFSKLKSIISFLFSNQFLESSQVTQNSSSMANDTVNVQFRLTIWNELVSCIQLLRESQDVEILFIFILELLPLFPLDNLLLLESCFTPFFSILNLLSFSMIKNAIQEQYDSVLHILWNYFLVLCHRIQSNGIISEQLYSIFQILFVLRPCIDIIPLLNYFIWKSNSNEELLIFLRMIETVLSELTRKQIATYYFDTMPTSFDSMLGILQVTLKFLQSNPDSLVVNAIHNITSFIHGPISVSNIKQAHKNHFLQFFAFLNSDIIVLQDAFFYWNGEYSNNTKLSEWIRLIKTHFSKNNFCFEPMFFAILIGQILIQSRGNSELRNVIIETMTSFLSMYLEFEGGLLFQPLILQELAMERDAKLQLNLLYTISKLGTRNFLNASSAIKIISVLNTENSLQAIVLRLYCELWINNDKVFQKLRVTLFELEKYNSLKNFDMELRMSITYCLNRVCKVNSNRGLELITLISKLLTMETDETCLILAVDAIHSLCLDGNLDFFIAWFQVMKSNVLSQSQNRPSLQIQICNLFECAIEISDLERDQFDLLTEYESDNKELAKQLVNQLFFEFCISEFEHVREAAYNTLCKFPLHILIYSFSNDEMKTIVVEEEESESDNIFALQERRKYVLLSLSQTLMQRIENENVEIVLKAMKPLCIKLMEFEFMQVKSKEKHNTQNQENQSSAIQIQSLNIMNLLNQDYHTKLILQKTICGALLWLGNVNLNKTVTPIAFYKPIFKDIIYDYSLGSSSDDYFLQIVSPSGFVSFMQKYYHVIANEELKMKKESPYSSAFDKIFEELTSIYNQVEVSHVKQNAILALFATVLVLPAQIIYHYTEKVVDFVKLSLTQLESSQFLNIFASLIPLSYFANDFLHSSKQYFDIISQIENYLSPDSIEDTITESALPASLLIQNLSEMENISEEYETEYKFFRDMAVKLISRFVDNTVYGSDWKDYSNIFQLLSEYIPLLYKKGDTQIIMHCYDTLCKKFEQIEGIYETETNESSIQLFLSVLVALPNIIIQLYRCQLIENHTCKQWISRFWNILNTSKNSSFLSGIYRNSCIGFGRLVFGLLSTTKFEEISIDEYQFYVKSMQEHTNSSQNLSISSRLGSCLCLASLLGINFTSLFMKRKPENKSNDYMYLNVFSTSLSMNNETVLESCVLDGMESLVKVYNNAKTDLRLKKYTSIILGLLVDLYKVETSDVEDGQMDSSSESIRIDPRGLEDSTLPNKLLQSIDSKSSNHIQSFAMNAFTDCKYLMKTNWQKVLRSYTNAENAMLFDAMIPLLIRDASTNQSSKKIILTFVDLIYFKKLDTKSQVMILKQLPIIFSLFPVAKNVKIITELYHWIEQSSDTILLQNLFNSFESIIQKSKTSKVFNQLLEPCLFLIKLKVQDWKHKFVKDLGLFKNRVQYQLHLEKYAVIQRGLYLLCLADTRFSWLEEHILKSMDSTMELSFVIQNLLKYQLQISDVSQLLKFWRERIRTRLEYRDGFFNSNSNSQILCLLTGIIDSIPQKFAAKLADDYLNLFIYLLSSFNATQEDTNSYILQLILVMEFIMILIPKYCAVELAIMIQPIAIEIDKEEHIFEMNTVCFNLIANGFIGSLKKAFAEKKFNENTLMNLVSKLHSFYSETQSNTVMNEFNSTIILPLLQSLDSNITHWLQFALN